MIQLEQTSLCWVSANFPRHPHSSRSVPSWEVLIHRTDNLIMRHTYYWYYAAEARLPWSPSERHLIFSPPSSLSMGPSVVENEFSLICMTDKHILYLSHRRSYAMDLGTWERKWVRGWNDAWSYLCEWGKWGRCVCLSVCQSSDVGLCLHNLQTCNVYVCPLAMPLFLCWWFQIYISMWLCACLQLTLWVHVWLHIST